MAAPMDITTSKEEFIDMYMIFIDNDDYRYWANTPEYQNEWRKYTDAVDHIRNNMALSLAGKGVCMSGEVRDIIVTNEQLNLFAGEIGLHDFVINEVEDLWNPENAISDIQRTILEKHYSNVYKYFGYVNAYLDQINISEINDDTIMNILNPEQARGFLNTISEDLIDLPVIKDDIAATIETLYRIISFKTDIYNCVNDNSLAMFRSETCAYPIKAILISVPGHMISAIVNDEHQTIEIFDPSYNEPGMNKYIVLLSRYYEGYTIRPAIVKDIQAASDSTGNLDIFCQTWSLHYIYTRLILEMNREGVKELYENAEPERFREEIMIFILKHITDDMITELNQQEGGAGNYYHKYIKYKHKYMNSK
jgi:hypothetical protein